MQAEYHTFIQAIQDLFKRRVDLMMDLDLELLGLIKIAVRDYFYDQKRKALG
jgi:hypothetical protein